MVTTTEVDAEQELASLCGGLNASYARLVAVVAQARADESWASSPSPVTPTTPAG
jgi:hypothetical protein